MSPMHWYIEGVTRPQAASRGICLQKLGELIAVASLEIDFAKVEPVRVPWAEVQVAEIARWKENNIFSTDDLA